ncbi:hypothetical protein AB1Y20_004164 [Prymnesium parvum]|uniref:Solute carrier family 40 protein n=1 Tax=Prymnesium parvum TaxID=97485 RepID=A0AB34J972_PRYPA
MLASLRAASPLRRALRALPPSPSLASAHLSTRPPAPRPAICAVHLQPREGCQRELEVWLLEGRKLLSTTLHAARDQASAPSSWIVGTDTRGCYHWVHIPSHCDEPDTVAIVFTSGADLSLWRQSEERAAWLRSGVARGLARDGKAVLVDASKIQLARDDGSLGGWLPAGGETAERAPPPPSWKVAATVLLAMYPVQELNRLALLPALAGVPAWEALPATAQVFCVCAWTCGGVTVALLPLARGVSERLGFIGGARGCPPPAALAGASARLLALYGLLVGVGLGVSAAVGPVQPRGVWSALPHAAAERRAER